MHTGGSFPRICKQPMLIKIFPQDDEMQIFNDYSSIRSGEEKDDEGEMIVGKWNRRISKEWVLIC